MIIDIDYMFIHNLILDNCVESAAYQYLYKQRTSAVLYYNTLTPLSTVLEQSVVTTTAIIVPKYDQSIEVSLDQTLYDVKCLIAQQLHIIDINSFHCKRNNSITGMQFKDESKTLRELSLSDRSILHLQAYLIIYIFI